MGILLRAENFYMEYCLVSSCSFNPQETYVLCHTAHGNVVGFTPILSFCPMVNYINSNLMLNHLCISVMSSTVMMDSLYIYRLCALIFIHKFIFLCCSYLIWCQIYIGLLQILPIKQCRWYFFNHILLGSLYKNKIYAIYWIVIDFLRFSTLSWINLIKFISSKF